MLVASWSSGRVQESGSWSRSSPGFNTLLVRLPLCPWARHFTLHCFSRTRSKCVPARADLYAVSPCCMWAAVYSPGSWDGYPDGYMRTGNVQWPGKILCQSLQRRALSLDVDSNSDFSLCFNISVANIHWTISSLMLYLLVKTLSMRVAIVVFLGLVWVSLVIESLNTWLQGNFQSEDEDHVSEDQRYSHSLYNKACEILIQEYHSHFRQTEQYWNLVDNIQAQSQAAWRHYLFL